MANVQVIGCDVVIRNLDRYCSIFKQNVAGVVTKAGSFLVRKVTDNVSLTDHSLKDLAAMGHPYRAGGPGLHDGPKIHKQSGGLASTLDAKKVGDLSVEVGFSPSAVGGFVFEGTRKMQGRPVLEWTLKENQSELVRLLEDGLRAAHRKASP